MFDNNKHIYIPVAILMVLSMLMMVACSNVVINSNQNTCLVAASDSTNSIKRQATYVCDGIADEIEINSALASFASKSIVLMEGTYHIAGGIIVPSFTTLHGNGWNTKILRTTGSSNTRLIKDITSSQTTIEVSNGLSFTAGQTIWLKGEYMYIAAIKENILTVIRGHNASASISHVRGTAIYFAMEVIRNEKNQEGGTSGINIRDLFIDGGSEIQGIFDSPGITLRKCSNSLIENCWVQNVRGSKHPKNSETDVMRGGGIQVDNSEYVSINGCQITKTSHAGIAFRNNSRFCKATENSVWEVGYEGIDIGTKTFEEYASEKTIGEGCTDISIINNNIVDAGMLGGSAGIVIDDQSTYREGNRSARIYISGNRITKKQESSKMGGITTYMPKQSVTTDLHSKFTIESNVIKGCSYSGISLSKTCNSKIEGNSITSNGNNGISISYADNIDISHNRCEQNLGYGVGVYDSNNILVGPNILKGNSKGSFYANKSSSVVQTDNMQQ